PRWTGNFAGPYPTLHQPPPTQVFPPASGRAIITPRGKRSQQQYVPPQHPGTGRRFETTRAMRVTLKVTAGPHQDREFTFLGHEIFLVGRSKRAHFRHPKDRYFSRIHFLVEVNPPRCRLMDMGSRNGTYLNGEKVTVADLKHGDQIKAGRTILRI